jgi:hypothetical protein
MPRVPNIQVIPSIFKVDLSMPKDPALRAVAEDLLAQLKYRFAAAAAENVPDKVFQPYLASRSGSTRERYQQQTRALLAAPQELRARHFRRYAAIGVEEYRTLAPDQRATRIAKLPVAQETLKPAFQRLTKTVAKMPPGVVIKPRPPTDPDLQAGLAFKKLSVFVTRVRCIEETDDWSDSDEINLGGTATGPFGDVRLVDEMFISDDFDRGEVEEFGFGKVFCNWMLETNSEGFPYAYGIVVALAEKDDGGF